MGVDHIEEINIQENPAYFAEMQQLSGRRSVPQIFIGSTHVGGYTDIYAMHQHILQVFHPRLATGLLNL